MLPEGENASSIVSEGAITPRSWRSKIFISGETAVSSNMDDVRKRVFAFTSQKKVPQMVLHAINVIGADGRGASVQSITKWIIANSEVLDIDKTKIQVKRAVLKALNNGIIQRSANSKKALGVAGSFVPSEGVKTSGSFSRKPKAVLKRQKIKGNGKLTEETELTPQKGDNLNESEIF